MISDEQAEWDWIREQQNKDEEMGSDCPLQRGEVIDCAECRQLERNIPR